MTAITNLVGIIWELYIGVSVLFTTLCFIGFLLTRRAIKSSESNVIETSDSSVKLVYLEEVDENILMYDSLTNEFIAMSPDSEELTKIAQERFPSLTLVVDKLYTS